MPAPRLPWFKVWMGATSNPKTAPLSDAVFRTWVELLDAAAQQQCRGRFKDQRSAAAIVRRPVAHVASLVTGGLIDEAEDKHLTMHDWDEWQRWRKEDQPPTNHNGTTPESPPEPPPEQLTNGHLIDSRTTHEPLPERIPDERTPSSREDVRRKTRDVKTREDAVVAAVAASPDAREFTPLGAALRRLRPAPDDLPEEVRQQLRRPSIAERLEKRDVDAR